MTIVWDGLNVSLADGMITSIVNFVTMYANALCIADYFFFFYPASYLETSAPIFNFFVFFISCN